MKTAALLAVAGAALAFAACAQSKKTTKNNAKNDKTITAVRMSRGACFGRCPVYAIELKADGSARYYGKMFTAHQGIWEKNIGAAKASSLLQQYATARVDTCQETYNVPVSDLPSLHYTFTYGSGMSKQVDNASFGPDFLSTYARRMDEMVQVDQSWRKVADTVMN